MFLGDSIGRAVEELWQLAMTMASLKHIAGMVTEELQTTTASTGLGVENKETADSHRHSQVDKTEAVSNKCFANNDIIATDETEQDALLYNSVHQEETASHANKTDLINNTENEDEKVFEQISMVAHKLAEYDAPQEISELPVSMAAHAIHTNDEEERLENHENISMISHQISDQYITVEPVMIEQETGILYNPSVCTHEIPYLETPAESSEHQVSMVAHAQHIFEYSTIQHEEDALSKVCHQTSEHYSVEAGQVEEQDQELVEDEGTDNDENLIFISSMVNHQLSNNESLLEVSEIPVSMATHGITSYDMEDTTETSQSVSMIAHQISNEDKSISQDVPFSINDDTDAPDHEEILKEDKCFIPSVCTLGIFNTESHVKENEEQQVQTIAIVNPDMSENEALDEPKFISSMVAHHQAPCDPVLELSEIPLTMAAHVIIADMDTPQHISMIVHQITNTVIDTEHTVNVSVPKKIEESNICNIFYPSMSTHEKTCPDTPVEPLECQVSMVTHCQHSSVEHEGDVLSMVCHQATIQDNIKNNQEQEISKTESLSTTNLSEDEEVVLTFSSSMVAHQLPTLDTLSEFPDMSASMATHIINTHSMDEGEEHQNMSMLVHQIINENKSILQDANVFSTMSEGEMNDNDVAYEEVCETNNETAAEKNFLPTESVMIPALSTKQDAPSKIPNYHQEFSALASENSAEGSEEIKENPCIVVCSKEEKIIEDEEEIYPVSLKHNYLDTIEVQKPSFLSSMVSHQLPYIETPTEFPNFLVSSATHGYSSIIPEDQGLALSMLSHQSKELNLNNTTSEDDAVTHGSSSKESHSSLQSGLGDSMLALHARIINKANEKDRLEKMDHNPRYSSDPQEAAFMTSLASHQLPSLSPCEQLESHDCFTSMAAHQDMATGEEKDFVSLETHIASNDVSDVKEHQELVAHDEEETIKPDEIIEPVELVENITRSYTDGSHKKDLPQREEESSNNCEGIITVGTEEGKTTETFDNFENNEVLHSHSSKLDRILELKRLVEDEIEEFENKKNNDSKIIENNVERTETCIVSNVKNVEFQSCIVIHQQVYEKDDKEDPEYIIDEQISEEYEQIKDEENWTDDASFSSTSESVNSVICTTFEPFKNHDEQKRYKEDERNLENCSDQEDVLENVIKASCTLENNSPVIITTNHSQPECLEIEPRTQDETEQHDVIEDSDQEETENEGEREDFDEQKMQMRKIPRRSSNAIIKIRETELLNSLFKEGFKEAEEKCEEKAQEKQRKHSITLATFNESVKKQTYKIRFKISLNKDSSKSSVLQYLLGCFGGEKLFHQK